ncbi:MAG TPA: site-2 protease family protein [Opitutaceae bacterium]|jgi:Zn-dependent protease
MFRWSINLFSVRGIKLAIHWTFFAFLAYVSYAGWQESGMHGLVWGDIILVAFFFCVVLHEFGHSLTAMRFGVGVRRILLTPIGGIAELDRIPRKPSQELLITVMGPAVNFVIAGILYAILRLRGPEVGDDLWASLADFGQVLLVWNLKMGLFNLIPAFPMDGGRILRASLAFKMPYLRATYWAAMVAKVITVIGGIAAIYFDEVFLVAICAFIYMAGNAEYQYVRRAEIYREQWRQMHMRPVDPIDSSTGTASEPPVLGP